MNKKIFKNKVLMITGGTGSYGKALVKYLLINKFPLKKIIVFSRDELKQFNMENELSNLNFKNVRFLLGDIRDKDRLKIALRDVDYVIHAAALKQVPAAEYNPFEFVKTNVLGANNLVEACIGSSVKKVLALSTDKASSPGNLYGATKLCSDKIFLAANNIIGNQKISFSVLRYGNVLASRGSVVGEFLKQKKNKVLNITHKEMTRFNITIAQAVKLSIEVLINSYGGEIFVPKIKSYKLLDLAKAICEQSKIKIIGLREGEKIHEEMISKSDSFNTYDIGKCYAIVSKLKQKKYKSFKKIPSNTSYASNNNAFLSIADIKKMIFEEK